LHNLLTLAWLKIKEPELKAIYVSYYTKFIVSRAGAKEGGGTSTPLQRLAPPPYF